MSTIFKRNVNHYRLEIQKKTSCALGLSTAPYLFLSHSYHLNQNSPGKFAIEPYKSEIIVLKTTKKHFVGFKRGFATVKEQKNSVVNDLPLEAGLGVET